MSCSTHEPFPPSQSKIIRPSNAHSDPVAFLGACHAFSQQKSPTRPLINNYSGRNGALAAATSAGNGKQKPARTADQAKAMYYKTESSLNIGRSPMIERYTKVSGRIGKEDLMQVERGRGQSPSHIAAFLAASKPSSLQNTSPHSFSKDDSSILATKALVKLFESHTGAVAPSFRASISSTAKPLLQNGGPSFIGSVEGRPLGLLRAPEPAESSIVSNQRPRQPSEASKAVPLVDPDIARDVKANQSFAVTPGKPERILRLKRTAPTPPPPRRTRQDSGLVQPNERCSATLTKNSDEISSPSSSYASVMDAFQPPSAPIRLSPTRKSSINRNHRSSNGNTRSVSGNNLSGTMKHSHKAENPVDTKLCRDGLLLPCSLKPQLTADSLANAMVASSLASSRAPSPNRQAPPLPRRLSKPHSLFHRSQSQDQDNCRTPSPGRGMRHTMREPSKPGDDDDFKKRNGHLLKKHPNKHHEGDRKRWRDQITEHERKRYEGVWAANKGLCMPPGDMTLAAKVLNLAVRDVWRRSKLPDHVLGEVWDLVDGQGQGKLSREEFVVGLWLIDQRLKGRKLPVRVSESVWSSARGLTGIKVPRSHR